MITHRCCLGDSGNDIILVDKFCTHSQTQQSKDSLAFCYLNFHFQYPRISILSLQISDARTLQAFFAAFSVLLKFFGCGSSISRQKSRSVAWGGEHLTYFSKILILARQNIVFLHSHYSQDSKNNDKKALTANWTSILVFWIHLVFPSGTED